jgi:hypothetical protein
MSRNLGPPLASYKPSCSNVIIQTIEKKTIRKRALQHS